MTWKPDICIHHFPCDDGYAAAWVAKRKWPDIQLVGTNYGQPFPGIDIAGKNLLIADFSYKPGVIEKLCATAKSIVILDHHKTAQADLQSYMAAGPGWTCFSCDDLDKTDWFPAERNVVAFFHMDHSGAALTWNFCFPGDQTPFLIRVIEDRDLWRFALPDTRRVSLFLRSFPYDIPTWNSIADGMEDEVSRAAMLGNAKAIERFYDLKIAEMLPTATLKSIGKWKDIPVAHAPYAFASDLANELLKAHPQAPFAAVVVDAYGGRTYSLRSEDSREDVSEVAKTFGGGGHRNAAGFRVPV